MQMSCEEIAGDIFIIASTAFPMNTTSVETMSVGKYS